MGNPQKLVGAALIVLGGYCLLQYIGLDLIDWLFGNIRFSFWYHRYFQSVFISVLFIAGGFWLLLSERWRGKPRGK
jgi:thiosulfate reductase cytochrome b subunit